MSEILNEKLQALNTSCRVELISTINYPIREKWVCQEIKNNVVKQLQGVEVHRVELKKLTKVGFSGLWKEDNSLVLEVEFLKSIQEDSEKTKDIDLLLSSFDEVNLFKFFYQYAHKGVTLQ